MKKKMYISLPISGWPLHLVKQQAKDYAAIWSDEYDVITPFDVNPDSKSFDYAHYMGRDIEALLRCECIYMAPGWVQSKGCNIEYQVAKICGLEIFG